MDGYRNPLCRSVTCSARMEEAAPATAVLAGEGSRSGYLLKRSDGKKDSSGAQLKSAGNDRKKWNRRWFVLDEQFGLSYWKDEKAYAKGLPMSGSIGLIGAKVEWNEWADSMGVAKLAKDQQFFSVDTPVRTLFLRPDDQTSAKKGPAANAERLAKAKEWCGHLAKIEDTTTGADGQTRLKDFFLSFLYLKLARLAIPDAAGEFKGGAYTVTDMNISDINVPHDRIQWYGSGLPLRIVVSDIVLTINDIKCGCYCCC